MIVVIMGVSGAGKTTVGELLAASFGWPFYDADDFHPPANVEKMSRGEPLNDVDREPWLDALAGLIRSTVRDGRSAVVACSALRAAYRAKLTAAGDDVRIVFLNAAREVIAQRMAKRTGHFMPASQLPNQFRTLQPPEDAIWVDAGKAPGDIVADIRDALR